MTNTIDQDRKDFEKWLKSTIHLPNFTLAPYYDGLYQSDFIQQKWESWQASAQLQRERQAQPTPSQSEPVAWMTPSEKGYDPLFRSHESKTICKAANG